MMKQSVLTFLCLSVSLAGTAQDNVAKFNLPGLIFGSIGAGYERAFHENMSVALDIFFLPERKMPFVNLFEAEGQDTALTSPFTNLRFSGFGVIPQFRYYTSGSEKAPRGFYIAAYLKYSSFKLTSSYEFSKDTVIDLLGRYSATGGGIAIGYQWIISDVVSIDWTFIGLGYGAGKISMTMTSDALNLTGLEEEANGISVNLEEIGKAEIDAGTKDVTLTLKRGVPLLRGSLTIGIAF